MSDTATLLVADKSRRVVDVPGVAAAGRSGQLIYRLKPGTLIPLPGDSTLFLLPGRTAVGFAGKGGAVDLKDVSPVAAFLPPGYVAFSLAAFDRQACAPTLPLSCYCAVCWYRGSFHVPATRIDDDPKHDPSSFDKKAVEREVRIRLKASPRNRLLAHHGLVCAIKYACPNAANLFLRRWEAPVAVAESCNARCVGCISKQSAGSVKSPQDRIGFVPTVDEILELAVPHLEVAPRAMVSFGQGCEGEPLLEGRLVESAIRQIRKRTSRGTIHLNTNGSRPETVKRLLDAGLDSIRISLNSARKNLYSAYYNCSGYVFEDVMASFRVARQGGIWTSINYLTCPGVTDDRPEVDALEELLSDPGADMIQWRNLNMDPDRYMEIVKKATRRSQADYMGIPVLIRHLRRRFPRLRMGYFNPPVKS